MLVEMEELGVELDEEEFVDSCMSLYAILNVDQRANLLRFKAHQHSFVNEELKFMPKIDTQSKLIFEGDELSGLRVEERLYFHQQAYTEKLRKMQTEAY